MAGAEGTGSRTLVASTWDELDPGNVVLRRQAEAAVQGVWAAGGEAREVSLCGPGEPIGAAAEPDAEGRDLLAAELELAAAQEAAGAVVAIAASGPALAGALAGLARGAAAAVLVPGGPSVPGVVDGREVTVEDVAAGAGRLAPERLESLIERAWVGSGVPPVQGPAGTMACVVEAMGLCVPGSAGPPALYQSRDRYAHAAGVAAVRMAARGETLRDLVGVAALENATAAIAATGGDPEALHHLLALAAELGLEFDLERAAAVIERTPRLADLRPHGRFDTVAFARNGGAPALIAALLERGLLDGSVPTVGGASLAEAYGGAPAYRALPVFAADDAELAPTLTFAGGEIRPGPGAASVPAPADGDGEAVRRSAFRALGLGDRDLERPLVGIASIWREAAPAGAAALMLGEAAEQGAWIAGMTPRRLAAHSYDADAPAAAAAQLLLAATLERAARRNGFEALLGIAAEELGVAALISAAVALDLPVAIAALAGLAPDRESQALGRIATELGMAAPGADSEALVAAEAAAYDLGAATASRLRAGETARAGLEEASFAAAAAAVGELGAAPDTLLWLRDLSESAGRPVALERLVAAAAAGGPGRLALLGGETLASAPAGAPARIEAELVELPAAEAVARIEAGVPAGAALLVRGAGAGPRDLGRRRELCAAADRSAAACLLLAGRPPRCERLAVVGAAGAAAERLDRLAAGGRVEIDFEAGRMEVGG